MGTKAFHSAIVSLKLPGDMSASEEIEALRAAGIPVDAQCNAEFGFLFVRASVDKKTNYFRWFAGDIGSCGVPSFSTLNNVAQPNP
ncbi:hypothetical protein [Variovorax sp. GB1P17]|uniref:hypothetical protein n=1 Tax=Variovorax sp. GB1P17 TaxID=3443740 RepID=UPI003F484835